MSNQSLIVIALLLAVIVLLLFLYLDATRLFKDARNGQLEWKGVAERIDECHSQQIALQRLEILTLQDRNAALRRELDELVKINAVLSRSQKESVS